MAGNAGSGSISLLMSTPETASLVGDFNGWDDSAHPMKKKADGTFYIALTLDTGREYQYRYSWMENVGRMIGMPISMHPMIWEPRIRW